MIIDRSIAFIGAALVMMLAAPVANAADAAVEPPPEVSTPGREWTFTIAPYFWAAGLQGDVGIFDLQPINIDMSFDDIFDSLRFGGMVVGEAHNGSWGVLADLIYVETEVDQSITRTVAGVPASLSASVETSSLTATILGEYRVISQPTATMDLMAGARIWSVDNDIDVSLGAGGPRLAEFSGSDGATWVDPIVGIKGRVDFNPSWYLTGWGMVGGFGAGSDVTWDLFGGVGYQWNDWLSVVVGYRALGVDYDDDGFVYDVVQHGPIFGTAMRF